jgi:hypothetical protein
MGFDDLDVALTLGNYRYFIEHDQFTCQMQMAVQHTVTITISNDQNIWTHDICTPAIG